MTTNEFFERVCSIEDFKDCIRKVLVNYNPDNDAMSVLHSFAECAE